MLDATFVILFAKTTSFYQQQAESSIQEKVGSDCRNEAQFSSAFTTESGEECTTCTFCDGSDLSDVFKPKSNGVCIDCTAAEDKCANFMITTAFDSAWLMKFVSLTPSSKPTEYDPKTVVIEGSTDTSAWVELHKKEDNLLFKTRSEPTELLLSNNDAEYKHYRVTFKPQDNKSKYYPGHYGLFQSYTKTCASNIYEAITGHYIMPYETLAPTEAPTAKPTANPTTVAQFNYNWIDEDSADTGVLTFLTTEQVQDVQDRIIAGNNQC